MSRPDSPLVGPVWIARSAVPLRRGDVMILPIATRCPVAFTAEPPTASLARLERLEPPEGRLIELTSVV